MTVLRAPADTEYEALTALCLRSKAVHGYDAAFMAACADELRVDAARVSRGPAQVAVSHTGELVGYAQVIADTVDCWLEALFVTPEAIGTGVGRDLFQWATTAARVLGAREMTIDADPGAAGFYGAMGARLAGRATSGSIPGRELPRFILPL